VDVVSAVVEAGQRRIRPIMLTTTATLFGVLPLALGIGEGTDVLRPLALAVLGGIAVSKFATLVALPSLAVLCGFPRSERRTSRRTPTLAENART
jgi:HAE1 family hydrophobic/amphiphilic exporter-1